jgi:hypothetical protein
VQLSYCTTCSISLSAKWPRHWIGARPHAGSWPPAHALTCARYDHAARFLIEVSRKRPGAWWREDFTTRFANVNGLPGIIVDAPEGPVQTAAFEIEDDVIRALYIVRNPDKLRHLLLARHESGPE